MAVRPLRPPGQQAGTGDPLAADRSRPPRQHQTHSGGDDADRHQRYRLHLGNVEPGEGVRLFRRGIPCLGRNVECRFAMWPAAVHHGQWYRLFTAAFLHANIEHILFNMLTLAIVGSPVEAELGKLRFVALYVLSALGGSVGSYLLSSANEFGVGASGAIFGLMGAYFVLARRRGWEVGNIVALIVVNLVIGFASTTIDWRAHLGGMITGAVVTVGLARSADARRTSNQTVEVRTAVVTSVAAVGVLFALTLLPPGHVNL